MELAKKLTPQWVEIEHEGEKLEFLCAPLKGSQYLNVYSLIEDGKTGDAALAAVRFAVRDWRGFTRDGEPVPFSRALIESLDTIEAMPLLTALMTKILSRAELTETERKN